MQWQITDMKRPLSDSVQQALEYYEKKFGRVPNIVECSKDIQPVPVLSNVAFVPIKIPTNILLIGVRDENQKIRMDVETE